MPKRSKRIVVDCVCEKPVLIEAGKQSGKCTCGETATRKNAISKTHFPWTCPKTDRIHIGGRKKTQGELRKAIGDHEGCAYRATCKLAVQVSVSAEV
jgi:hypothetical protein